MKIDIRIDDGDLVRLWDRGIQVFGKSCWMCGTKKDLTNHHTLQQYLKPVKNIEVPLCRDCHQRLHSRDMRGLTAFAHRILRTLEDSKSKMKALKNYLYRQESETISDRMKPR